MVIRNTGMMARRKLMEHGVVRFYDDRQSARSGIPKTTYE